MIGLRYQQINADHTVFSQQYGDHITILVVYVDDIIITENDEGEIAQLNARLGKKFEIKDLKQFRYFFGIETAHGAKRIVLSQRNVLDLPTETDMLGCGPTVSSIDVKTKISADVGKHIDRERYQKLVDKLIYLCHARPDISFAVSVVSHYMHDLRKDHMDATYHIWVLHVRRGQLDLWAE
jgi:Reverse transcriptase (RNA-dependent DNA polymerase)